ncbi:MAG TPA: tetratricopeptide repeat protein, partial [Candidatus Nitrosotenuis sp.]|nr:tetratricopeptide repeat protein [Candidatus Nitrosotenuis sp.]
MGVAAIRVSSVLLAACLLVSVANLNAATVDSQDWLAEVRARLAEKNPQAALEAVERRLSEKPNDLEARGWRGRILSWLGRWAEAEADYRRVLEDVPDDVDILLGLAHVLAWQKRFDEALVLLERAQALQPRQADVHLARGRVLRGMGRSADARRAYQDALDADPNNAEARRELDALEDAPRHRLQVGSDFEFFNFTSQDAQSYRLSLRSDLSSRWTSMLGTQFDRRFSQQAGRFLGSLTYRLTPRDSFTVGGAVARDQGVIPKGETFVEYTRGISISREKFVRGMELGVQQRWLWFDAARIVATTPSVIFYLPRDWMWSVSITVARTRIAGGGVEWRPSGSTRLSFPVHPRVTGNVFYGVGTENFAVADQLGRFSARTFGGGARVAVNRRQAIWLYA